MSRWTDLAQWFGTTAHGGEMHEHRGLVLHIAEGYYRGTIAWQQDKSNEVSSHFIVGRDGDIAQMVDTDVTAWTQREGNGHWLSAEFEGFTTGHRLHATHPGWERLSDKQVAAAAKLLVRANHQYGVPLQLATTSGSRGLGHHSMGGADWGHRDCPGPPIIAQKAAIIALASGRPAPKPPTTTEDEVMADLPILRSGSSGALVRSAQALANVRLGGGDVATDGAYGPKTIAIIKRLQAGAHIAQDGVCGPKTWRVLLGLRP